MKFLIVSDREYRKTSRGIDMITTYLAEKDNIVDHMVFFKRKKIPDINITKNIRQIYFYDFIKFYRSRLQFLLPGFALLAYFKKLIRNQTSVNFDDYDYIILESGHPLYLALEINQKIIYRQSDPINITFNSNRKFYKDLEMKVIEKSLLTFSALENKYFPDNYRDKIYFWHSGFIPCLKFNNSKKENYFVIMGGRIDWLLINKIAKKHPEYQFNIIGIDEIMPLRKNIKIYGYLDYDSYQNMLTSALAVIIPFSNHYVNLLKQVNYTAKILVSMDIGLPVLVRAYGNIQNSDEEKKMYVYHKKKDAIILIDEIIAKIKNKLLTNDVSLNTRKFLLPHTSENRLKELDLLFKMLPNKSFNKNIDKNE